MVFPVLFLTILAGQAPPTQPVKPPMVEQVVSGRSIQLPDLPENADRARAEYSKTRSQITTAIQDLEKHLRELYALSPSNPLPESVRTPKSQAKEVKFLATMVHDEAYAAKEKAVLDAWDAWQSLLLENSLAKAEKGSDPAANSTATPTSAERWALKNRLEGMRKADSVRQGEYADLVDAMTAKAPGNTARGGDHPNARIVQGFRSEHEEKVLESRRNIVVTNTLAPVLAHTWNPLTAYLNECAAQFEDFDHKASASEEPGLKALRLHAKIGFMERYRSSLWFCHLVWARMASAQAPTPLGQLP